MDLEKKCATGCRRYNSGEIRHHKECISYVDSLSRVIDALEEKSFERLVKASQIQTALREFVNSHESYTTLQRHYRAQADALIKEKLYSIDKYV